MRFRRKLKNIILKTITTAAAIIYMLAVFSVESHPDEAFMVASVSGIWILLFIIANKERFGYCE